MVKEFARDEGDALGFELSLAVVMYHQAVADRLGVNNTEHKVLDLVARHPDGMTPGELVAATGLSNAAVTKVVDKLVGRGYVQRRRSSEDRRSVRVETASGYATVTRPSSAGLAERIWTMNESFEADELAAVGRWVRGAIEALRAETRALGEEH